MTVYTNFFGGAFFGGGFFGSGTDDAVKTGTGGIDPGEGHKRVPFKPTGLVDRLRKATKEGRKEVEDRVDDSREIESEIAVKLAREFREETIRFKAEAPPPIVKMTLAEIDFEIGVLLRKKLKTEEDDLMLILLMAAAT